MKSLNHCTFIGNLGKEPELSHTPSGIAVAKFSIACSEKWKDGDGNQQEKTEWINLVAWRKLAEVCGQYLKKGSKVYVSGKFTTHSWEKDGVKRYATEVVIDDLIMLDGKSGEATATPEPATAAEPEKDDLPF